MKSTLSFIAALSLMAATHTFPTVAPASLSEIIAHCPVTVRAVEVLPQGFLEERPAENTGTPVTITIDTSHGAHEPDLCSNVALQELCVSNELLFASHKTHYFCQECLTYNINNQCGYVVTPEVNDYGTSNPIIVCESITADTVV